MSPSWTESCQCGAVRHEFSGEPLFCGNCHCRDCQCASGGAYFPAFRVPAESSGMPAIIAVMAGSLDDPSRFNPGVDIYTSSAQPWTT
jgi:hypothetical protein